VVGHDFELVHEVMTAENVKIEAARNALVAQIQSTSDIYDKELNSMAGNMITYDILE
jgi:hypothetical protein